MLNEKLAVLITRHLSGEASVQEQEELFALLKDEQGEQYFLDLMMNYWKAGSATSPPDDINADEHFNHILALADEADNIS